MPRFLTQVTQQGVYWSKGGKTCLGKGGVVYEFIMNPFTQALQSP